MRPLLLSCGILLLCACAEWPAPRSAGLTADPYACPGGHPELLEARLAALRVARSQLYDRGLADCQPGLYRRLAEGMARADQAFHGDLNAALASDIHELEQLTITATRNLQQLQRSGCADALPAGDADSVPQARWATELDDNLEALLP